MGLAYKDMVEEDVCARNICITAECHPDVSDRLQM